MVGLARGIFRSPKANVPKPAPEGHQADDHPEVADAIDDERLVRRVAGALPLDVKPDQEIRANADQLPEHEHHENIAGDHQPQHAEAKQRQILEEPVVAARAMQMLAIGEGHFMVGDIVQLVVHVAHRVEMDARSDQRDHREHDDRQRVDVIADRQL